MRRLILHAVILCCIIPLNAMVNAQTQSGEPSSKDRKGQSTKKSPAAMEADQREAEARRAFAVQVVLSSANEARSYKDESLRASVQARAADILWQVDQEHARLLFGRAWEAAVTVDKEGRRRNEEERTRFLTRRGGTGFIPPPPNLRAEVLRLVSIHDRALAESFLAKMEEEDKREEEDKSASKSWDPTEPPEAVRKRLELARQLLENGETERAVLIAVPGLSRATSQAIIFLVRLRQTNKTQADRLFASMLEKVAADALSDATAVSLLASYAFTPSVLVTVTRNGLLMNPWTETLPAPDLSPQLRQAFFRVAAQVLLRPASPQELELTSAGRAGTYFTIVRLLPLFEQFEPDAAVLLKGRLTSLAQNPDEIIPEQQRSFANAGFTRNETEKDEADDILSRIERASSTTERDELYAAAARIAVMKDDPKAQALADKIESLELKKRVRNFVDFILVSRALEKKEIERAMQLVRAGELLPFQRAWVYTELTSLLNKSAPESSQGFITEAATQAKRIDITTPESPQAWVAIARRTMEVDRARTWEIVPEALKAANRVSGYTGEESKISVRLQSRTNVAILDIAAPSISLANLFEALAREDLYQAIDMARGLSGESPRSLALLSAARAEFERATVKRRR
jgi:hypothetical protein